MIDQIEHPTQENIVTNLINSRFEQFILRDEVQENSTNNVELISYTEHHKKKNNINKRVPNNNNNTQSQKNNTSSPAKTTTTSDTPVNSNSSSVTLKSHQTPTGPKGKRPPSKTYIQQKSSKGDVFDELNSRQIHNIGRVESIRGPKGVAENTNSTTQKSTSDTTISNSVTSNKLHAIEMAITTSSANEKINNNNNNEEKRAKTNSLGVAPDTLNSVAPSPQLLQKSAVFDTNLQNSIKLTPEQQERVNELGKAMDKILLEMKKSRLEKNRPERPENMNKQQLMDEKQELQKMLLKFEEEYSRPSQSHEKNKVRVVYDLYRNVKRHLLILNSGETSYEASKNSTLRRNHVSSLNPKNNNNNPSSQISNFVTPVSSSVPSRQVSLIARNAKKSSVSTKNADDFLKTLRDKSLEDLKGLLKLTDTEYTKIQLKSTQTKQELSKMAHDLRLTHSNNGISQEQFLTLLKNHPDYIKLDKTHDDLKNRLEQLKIRNETIGSIIKNKDQ